MRWTPAPFDHEAAARLQRSLGCAPTLAELLAQRGLHDPARAQAFLQPRLSELGDPFAIHSLEEAADRLLTAALGGERIVLLGDYDVDGVTSTTLLTHFLRRLGAAPRYYVPRRMEEGYGLTMGALDRVLEECAPQVFVALDCGTNSADEVSRLREAGCSVIIIDHHRSKGRLPDACTLVNPHARDDSETPGTHLCTVGLVFKLVHGMTKKLRQRGHPGAEAIRLREYLDWVALGTVADLVPLLDENRILAAVGLTILRQTTRPGLHALMEVAGLDTQYELRPVDVSFRLGPRINASGRLADAALAVDLLLSQDAAFCSSAAAELDGLNRERQDIERQILETADARLAASSAEAAGLVVFDPAWHPGVVGIVASRLSRKHSRPSIVLGLDGDLAKGSGRSVAGINLVQVLAGCESLLESWGGHPMAVGVSLRRERVAEFTLAFDAAIRRATGGQPPEPELVVNASLPPEAVTEQLLEDIEKLHPFGEGNREPVLALRSVVLRQPPEVFKEQHFRFQVNDSRGRRVFGVAWKMADRLPPVGAPLDLAVLVKWNSFGGRRYLQLELVDWRPAV